MRKTLIRLTFLSFVCLLVFTPFASAWSYKEHIQLTRIAIERLLADPTTPPAMKDWLRRSQPQILDMTGERDFFMHARVGKDPKAFDGITMWAYMPDEHALNDPSSARVQPFGAHEKLMHYIDLELFLRGEQKRAYRHDLGSLPNVDDIPHDPSDPRFAQAGYLPLRIEQCYGELVKSIRTGQLDAPTTQESEGKTAAYWAGYLAHYLEDNTQPQHATIDYKSVSYFADKRGAPNVHGEVEYKMIDDAVNDYMTLREEFWPLFVTELDKKHDEVDRDPFKGSLQVSMISYQALPLIGEAAMAAAKQGGTPDHPTGPASRDFDTEAFFHHRGQFRGCEMSVMEMKAIQTAWAVQRVEQVLRQAWDEANR
jgi:hypothetical protein